MGMTVPMMVIVAAVGSVHMARVIMTAVRPMYMALGGLLRQPAVDAPQGQEHLRPRGGELAVAQHRELGVVHAAQVKGLGQGGENPVRPAVPGMPDPDQVGEADPASGKRVSKTQVILIRIAIILSE